MMHNPPLTGRIFVPNSHVSSIWLTFGLRVL